jgi:hypothetical protein
MKLKIDGELYEGFTIETYSDLPMLINGKEEYYLAKSTEAAGKVVRERWIDMQQNDKAEFRCLIGDERLIQWACDEYDSFGIGSFDEFLDAVENVPNEELASYDSEECEVTEADEEAIEELGFTPTVAYRHN